MFDSYNREINYLRISVTDRCNLRCIYCMPSAGIRLLPHSQILSYEEIVRIAGEATALGIRKIRLTGGEPLVRRHIADLVAALKRVPGIAEVALTSNGILLPGLARDLKRAGLDRINISLDTVDESTYRRITRCGELRAALAGIDAARAAGFRPIKINMVLLPGINDGDGQRLQEFCNRQGLQLQRIHHYRLDRPRSHRPLAEAERPQACSECNRIRLTADKKLKPCLFSDREIAVDFGRIRASLQQAIRSKPRRGRLCHTRQIWQIGG